MSSRNPDAITVTVVVSSVPVSVTANTNQHVEQLIRDALREAHKPHDIAGWQLRSESGHEFTPDQKIGASGILDGATLFLNKDAGGGG